MGSRRLFGVLLIALALTQIATIASAVPRGPRFGPFIEGFGDYEGQSTCSPEAKPGVLAFERMLLGAYPGTSSLGIARDCGIGGTSEHKEGRSLDWGVDATDADQKALADDAIHWLLRTDRYGNEHAMARRLGIMYIIWNRRIWMPYSGWRTYCVQKGSSCFAPGTQDARSPHTDHVHFSFTWAGAMKTRTFWHPTQSFVSDIDSESVEPAFWSVGGNGSVASSSGSSTFGNKGDGFLKNPIADIASTSTGGGYWLLSRNGRVSSFGDAARKGSVEQKPFVATAIAGTPTTKGYWVLGSGGRVFPFGDALFYGDVRNSTERLVSLTPTPSGKGYWLTTDTGDVAAFGDASFLGGLELEPGSVTAMDATPSGLGYWLVTGTGQVAAFGDARSFGDLSAETLTSPIVGMASTPSGSGYWLVSARGRIEKFGDAKATDARLVVPQGRVTVSARVAAPNFLPGD
jgi:hypothetical protein